MRKQFLLTLITDALAGLIGILTGSILARTLGPAGRGELAAIQTWPLFLCAIGSLGVPYAVVYYSARDPRNASSILASALVGTATVSVAMAFAGYLALPVLLHARTHYVHLARWFLLVIPLFGLLGMLMQPFLGLRRFAIWNTLRLTVPAVWLTVILGLRNIGEITASNLIFSYLGLLTLMTLIYGVYAWRTIPGKFRPELQRWRQQVRYGLPSVLSIFPQMLNSRLDQLLLVGLCSPHELGLYTAAVAWGAAPQMLLSATGKVLMPHVAGIADTQQRTYLLCFGVVVSTAVAATGCMFLLCLTPYFVPLIFGAPFTGAIRPSLFLVLSGSIMAANGCIGEGLRGYGFSRATALPDVSGLCATAVALTVAVPLAGPVGAAAACALGSLVNFLFLLVALHRAVGDYLPRNFPGILVHIRGTVFSVVSEPVSRFLKA